MMLRKNEKFLRIYPSLYRKVGTGTLIFASATAMWGGAEGGTMEAVPLVGSKSIPERYDQVVIPLNLCNLPSPSNPS